MDRRQRSNTGFAEPDPPSAEVVPVVGRVSRRVSARPTTTLVLERRATEVPDVTLARLSRVMTMAIAAFILALILGDEGPWILVVPGLTAVGAVWLDRRISFSFAEGLIGYRGDAQPRRGVFEEDWPTASQRSAPAAG